MNMSAQPDSVLLPTVGIAKIMALAVAGVIPLAMFGGWAPMAFLLTSVLAGLVTVGLYLLFFQTRNRLWLHVCFYYMVLPVAQLGHWFDLNSLLFHLQGVCMAFLPSLLMFTLGRSWVDRLGQDSAPKLDSTPSSPV
ncbi:hypothetical protein [Prosthecobacter debontii]|nr:hypothetical protein [Prosthecobacter debontii]